MTTKDGRAVARENEIRLLRALHRFGWLRTGDLAALVWQTWARCPLDAPDLKPPLPTVSGLRMAQRTLRRMREKRLVLSNRAPDGSMIHALAEAGVRALQQIGLAAVSGKDLIRRYSAAYYRHRCIANQIAVGAIVAGYRVATEREIARGLWMGGELGIDGKRPDVLVRSGDTVWWIEVECSRKNARDYAHLLQWLGKVARDAARPSGPTLLGNKIRWAKVIFVCTAAFETKLRRDLAASGWQRVHIDSCAKFETALYRVEDLLF